MYIDERIFIALLAVCIILGSLITTMIIVMISQIMKPKEEPNVTFTMGGDYTSDLPPKHVNCRHTVVPPWEAKGLRWKTSYTDKDTDYIPMHDPFDGVVMAMLHKDDLEAYKSQAGGEVELVTEEELDDVGR